MCAILMLQKSFFSFVKSSAAQHHARCVRKRNKIATPTNETAKKTLRDFGTESFAPGRCSKFNTRGGMALSLMLIVCDATKYDACCNAQPAFYLQIGNNVGLFIACTGDSSVLFVGRRCFAAQRRSTAVSLSPSPPHGACRRGECVLTTYSESTTPTICEKPQST